MHISKVEMNGAAEVVTMTLITLDMGSRTDCFVNKCNSNVSKKFLLFRERGAKV